MRLEGVALACVRGGREVFSGPGIFGRRRRGPAGDRAGMARASPRCCGWLRGWSGRPAGGSRCHGGDPERSIAEQAHYLGHLDALKPSLTVGENLAVLDALSRLAAQSPPRVPNRGTRGGGPGALWPNCRPPTSRPGSGGGCRIARLLAVKRPIWLLDEPTSALDRDAQDMLAGLMREHLSGGGMIVAATHGPIGLDRARELQLGAAPGVHREYAHERARGDVHAGYPARRARRRRRAASACCSS